MDNEKDWVQEEFLVVVKVFDPSGVGDSSDITIRLSMEQQGRSRGEAAERLRLTLDSLDGRF